MRIYCVAWIGIEHGPSREPEPGERRRTRRGGGFDRESIKRGIASGKDKCARKVNCQSFCVADSIYNCVSLSAVDYKWIFYFA